MRLKVFLQSYREVARAASHEIAARSAREFFSTVSRANNATSCDRKISSIVEQMVNRISRANNVAGGSRNASKARIVQKLSKTSLADVVTTITRTTSLPNWMESMYQSPLRKHSSDCRHHAIEFIRNPTSSYFHSQAFIFMRLSSLAMPQIANFTRNCNCHSMVN